jgi:hypothetical protein
MCAGLGYNRLLLLLVRMWLVNMLVLLMLVWKLLLLLLWICEAGLSQHVGRLLYLVLVQSLLSLLVSVVGSLYHAHLFLLILLLLLFLLLGVLFSLGFLGLKKIKLNYLKNLKFHRKRS